MCLTACGKRDKKIEDVEVTDLLAKYTGPELHKDDVISPSQIYVIAKYSDGKMEEVKDYKIENIDEKMKVGKNKLSISYKSKNFDLVIEAKENILTTTEETSNNIQENIVENVGENPLPVNPLSQSPELLTGCEVVSLTMALNYNGFNIDKCTLSDNYLPKGEVGNTDFKKAFVGNPRNNDSYGCYSPVIEKTANNFLIEQGSNLRGYDISGSEFENLFSYIDTGIPVIVWGTRNCEQGHYSVTWNVAGQKLQWYTPEHCMLLTGYDRKNRIVYVCDPLKGKVETYDLSIFNQRYNDLGKQAVIIK